VLTRSEVIELATDCGLAEHAETLALTVSAGWGLEPHDEPVGGPARSRLGGRPDMAAGESWPCDERGVPMAFLAQVATSSLPLIPEPWIARIDAWPTASLLRIFADVIDRPVDVSRGVALLAPESDARVPADRPAMPGWWPDTEAMFPTIPLDERYSELSEHALRATVELSAPETHTVLHPHGWVGTEPDEVKYDNWLEALRAEGGRPAPLSLLGHPRSAQEDVRDAALLHATEVLGPEATGLGQDPAVWRSLFRWYDGEGAQLSLLMPAQDLATLRFDRIMCVPEAI
jgi:hypothetical protein